MSLYTRVTEVLYPFSGLKGIDPEVLKNAADRGTATHKICDWIVAGVDIFGWEDLVSQYCRNEEHFEKEKVLVMNFVESFEKWYKGKNFIKKPDRFFDDDLMLTGECDLIYVNEKNELTLVDLKTPVNESKSWLLQGSAYSHMAKKNGYDIKTIEFVNLSRTKKDAKVFQYKEDFGLFKSALDTYRYFYKDSKEEINADYI